MKLWLPINNRLITKCKVLLATVTEAKDNLGRTTIYAPADGTISLLNVELGERVLGTQQMAGTEILRIANLNNMEVEVDVNENDIVKKLTLEILQILKLMLI